MPNEAITLSRWQAAGPQARFEHHLQGTAGRVGHHIKGFAFRDPLQIVDHPLAARFEDRNKTVEYSQIECRIQCFPKPFP